MLWGRSFLGLAIESCICFVEHDLAQLGEDVDFNFLQQVSPHSDLMHEIEVSVSRSFSPSPNLPPPLPLYTCMCDNCVEQFEEDLEKPHCHWLQ